jgi:alpha,alpha-trehalose phosphorylase
MALSNGHFGLRGNLDEGEPAAVPGTYLNGFYEVRPLPYAEAAYGDPEAGQTMINVTNGKLIRLLVDDEPFDLRYGILRRHERVLDLRAGVLRREVEWTSPTGQSVRIRSTRLGSFVQRSVAAICYEVEPLGNAAGMDHVVDGPEGTVTTAQSEPDLARVTVSTRLEPGQTLRLVKMLAYGWSSQRSLHSLPVSPRQSVAACWLPDWPPRWPRPH